MCAAKLGSPHDFSTVEVFLLYCLIIQLSGGSTGHNWLTVQWLCAVVI